MITAKVSLMTVISISPYLPYGLYALRKSSFLFFNWWQAFQPVNS